MDSNNPYRRRSSTPGVPPPIGRSRTNSIITPTAEEPSGQRRSSGASAGLVMTRSQGYGAAVAIDRPQTVAADSDLIFVAVRLRDEFRRASVDGAEELPSRPAPRSFLSRLHTRVSSSSSSRERPRYKAIKMPRGDFKRYFMRDAAGNYAGTEPERMWDEGELMREYGEYQDQPLGAIVTC